ncbi:Aste57867_18769 [Aphanomyces stellatus]|uniref:Aste57867_18769 protein n=1 Tax=Aphanomyces stellatus TaxID=120398 RepID=A0A485LCV6_9STRA|nr:hypothetical protein As57867_018705 [Aphanomyces stellatus]VFT95503.1 Aste57867_18769 [Aphanomyces stellatus]
MRRIHFLVLGCFAALAIAQSTQTCNTSAVRVRRPWSNHTTAEKKLFVGAVGDAMAAGFHHRFVEIHTEPSSENEAHGCMFLYWHRKFLLAYENMLRSLKPDYACLTLPYWDYATLSSSFVTGSCTNMYQCAKDLIDAFGGDVDSSSRRSWDVINGGGVPGQGCVAKPPLNNFCQSTTAFQRRQCMGCVPRSPLSGARVPSEANIVQVFSQILGGSSSGNGKSLYEATQGIQIGCHNTIHSALSGAMASFQSPADPLFYLHHGQVDLMHRIHFKCNVADTRVGQVPVLSDTEKQDADDQRIWSWCQRSRDGSWIYPTDPIRMIVGQRGAQQWDVHDPKNPLYPFFKDLPLSYYQYADGDDLGPFSYRYLYTGMLADMLTKCKQFVAPRRATVMMQETDAAASRGYAINPTYKDRCGDRPRSSCEVTESSFIDYISNAAANYGWSQDELIEQMDALVCVHHHECLGGCFDYSYEFKTIFRPSGPPRCVTVMGHLTAGRLFIKLPGWRSVMARFFPCNTPSTAL